MENKFKYTDDGKKVIVIGSLNSTDKIVQEIYVIDGSEIPSGEHFVVKSLHDAPAISWREQQLNEINDRYERDFKLNEARYNKMMSDFKLKTTIVEKKLLFLRKLSDNPKIKEQLDLLIDFMSGNIQYIVSNSYGKIDIIDFDVAVTVVDRYGFDSLKLVTLYGDSNGNLDFKLNEYSDGSGGRYQIYPCRTMEEARDKVVELFNASITDKINTSHIKMAETYNLEIPVDKLKQFYIEESNRISNEIADHTKQSKKLRAELAENKLKLKGI